MNNYQNKLSRDLSKKIKNILKDTEDKIWSVQSQFEYEMDMSTSGTKVEIVEEKFQKWSKAGNLLWHIRYHLIHKEHGYSFASSEKWDRLVKMCEENGWVLVEEGNTGEEK